MKLGVDVDILALPQEQSDWGMFRSWTRRLTHAEGARDIPGGGGYPPVFLQRNCLTDDDHLCSRYHCFARPYRLGRD
jgi:hypothetical protein